MCDILGWIEAHPGLASWVQAIGSIGAILVAFEVGRRQSKDQAALAEKHRNEDRAAEQSDRRLKMNAIAVAIFPELVSLTFMLNRLESSLRQMAPPGEEITIKGNDQLWAFEIGRMAQIERNYDRLYLLGTDLGPCVLQLFAVVGEINRSLKMPNLQRPYFNPSVLADGHVTVAQALVRGIQRDIAPIHEDNFASA